MSQELRELRPTFRADYIEDLPEIRGPGLGFDLLHHGELVFTYKREADGPTMLKRMLVQMKAGRATCEPQGWAPLPQAGPQVFDPTSWVGCDSETGDLLFLRGRTVCRVSPDGVEGVSFTVDQRMGADRFVLGVPKYCGGSFTCFNCMTKELYILSKDGKLRLGPCRLPDGQWNENEVHEGEFFRLEASAEWAYFSAYVTVYRWNLRTGNVESVVGLAEENNPPSVKDSRKYIKEGFGSQARIAIDQSTPCLVPMQSGIFMSSRRGILHLDIQTGELRIVDLVNVRGIQLPTKRHSGDQVLLLGDWNRQHLFVITLADAGTFVSQILVIDVSTDLAASTVVTDLRSVDYTQPVRQVPFEVGDPATRFELDLRFLVARCEHFARAFASGMRESQEGAVVRLEDTAPEAMQCFVHYLHTDEFELHPHATSTAPEEEVLEVVLEQGRLCLAVHQLADRYGVYRLRKLALLRLRRALNAATILPLLEETVGARAWDIDEEAPRAIWDACWEHWSEINLEHSEAVDGLVRRHPALAVQLLRETAKNQPEQSEHEKP